ncbi:MAG: hypothetical protein GC164_06820 [Phycisphaera sp.]|nr:hypothetical protein [Phycisphaera sp.]
MNAATEGATTNAAGAGPDSVELVVFSDDWGRHPSSCQHLVKRLLGRHSALWVNTIGTRSPGLSWRDLGKIAGKLRAWVRPRSGESEVSMPANLRVISPRMYPGFRTGWQRRLNARWVSEAVNTTLGPRRDGVTRIAVTTIPIVADIFPMLDVDHRVYYCVDDFSVWPGLDGKTMDEMERTLVQRVDRVVAVSQTIVDRLKTMGVEAAMLTHGIDTGHWSRVSNEPLPGWWPDRVKGPILLFWGVIDPRMDVEWCRSLVRRCGQLVLVGPKDGAPPALTKNPVIRLPGAIPYSVLPLLAQHADVLVMPYADLPVTRAMQPLKFKEYLATGKPTVVRALPATREWSDAADVVATADELVRVVKERAHSGLPGAQREARKRLADESWEAKADAFERLIMPRTRPGSSALPG